MSQNYETLPMEGFSISIEPSGFLGFHRPLRYGGSCSLSITNNNDQPIVYKVKTTHPKSYCVKPNCGRVEPLKRVTVTIYLRPMKEEPSPDEHKFLIESTLIDPQHDEHISPSEIFSLIKSSGESGRIHEQKLKVKFLPLPPDSFSISLEPSGFLGFHRPLRHGGSCSLSITNNNDQPIVFKVNLNTTDLNSYCVKPNCGRVEPLKRVTVTICLQPMKEETSPDACKHKFLIESTIIDPQHDEHISPSEIFSLIKSSGESGRIHRQKLKAKFLPPLSDNSEPPAKSNAPALEERHPGPGWRLRLGFPVGRCLQKLKAILCMEVNLPAREIRHERKGSTHKDAIEELPPYSYAPPSAALTTPASKTLDAEECTPPSAPDGIPLHTGSLDP